MSPRYFAATSSLPGGLVVSMRRNPCSQPIASTSICERVEFTGAEFCDAAPGPYGGVVVDFAPTGAGGIKKKLSITAHTTSRAGVRGRAILGFPQGLKFSRRLSDERYYHVCESRPAAAECPVSQVQSSASLRAGGENARPS